MPLIVRIGKHHLVPTEQGRGGMLWAALALSMQVMVPRERRPVCQVAWQYDALPDSDAVVVATHPFYVTTTTN